MRNILYPVAILILLLFGAWTSVFGQIDSAAIRQEITITVADITRGCHNDREKAEAIYRWITENISYDMDVYDNVTNNVMETNPLYKDLMTDFENWLLRHGQNYEDLDEFTMFLEFEKYVETIDLRTLTKNYKRMLRNYTKSSNSEFNRYHLSAGLNVFAERKGICSSIAHLYKLMCEAANIQCEIVLGFVFDGGVISGHAWNAVLADGKMILTDPTGGLYESNYFFDVNPQLLIATHFPVNPEYQNLKRTVSAKEFVDSTMDIYSLFLSEDLVKTIKRMNCISIRICSKHLTM